MTTLMQSNKRRTRFGKLPIGVYFMWQKIIYCKTGSETARHAVYNSKYGIVSVFADKALVYKMQFKRES